ncbi:ornithine cyclodeaminase [Phaeobacter sp. J2-8]|uniref:ornithine cyclodeaminase family protein n=1 Tax=Phaeobacter sp. J2-8 TaxID=2931394 RepID=UPI001FD0E9E0|nr:ornithine cyclodeaminase [Phaeobacter sp. J2-8]MCJ7873561.1 ornithine cyclodeaminase [Phaeobacter sp. J2-8]
MKIVTRQSFGDQIDWAMIVDAIDAGHRMPPAHIEDVFLGPPGRTLLSRAAWIEGLGYGVKSVTVMAENPARGLPTVQGAMLVFEDRAGALIATIDSPLVTDLKTASDSALGARYLARKDSKTLLILGAGQVARNVAAAYRQILPGLERIMIWNRTADKARALAADLVASGLPVEAVTDLADAAGQADIVVTATMSSDPVLRGEWITPGTHVDLIGAFRAEMREADDALLQKARIFVDSRDTTMHHIGELKIPLASGAIAETDVLADLYQLSQGQVGRTGPDDITVFKNGGGAHLDLMTAFAILGDVDQ